MFLEDQFLSIEVELGPALYFCNPVEKVHEGVVTPILDPDHHLTLYEIYHQQEPGQWLVEVNNQFGRQQLLVQGPIQLAVPTQKVEPWYHEPPVGLDHFLLYEVVQWIPDMTMYLAGLNDEFGTQSDVFGVWPIYFANPVRKTDASGMVTEIQDPQAHLIFYDMQGQVYSYPPVQAVNQFGEQYFPVVWGPYHLAVPSQKISWEVGQGQ